MEKSKNTSVIPLNLEKPMTELIAKYTPFARNHVGLIIKHAKSIDLTLRVIEYSMITNVSLPTALFAILRKEKNNHE